MQSTDDGGPRPAQGVRWLISFDIDGTLETGDPPGAILIAIVRGAKALGWFVGSCSDRPASAQRAMWELCGVDADFAVVKPQLHTVRERFAVDNYLHVGDTEADRFYAREAGFEFVHIDDVQQSGWWRELMGRGRQAV